jgi:sensor histidine kinase YesM
MERIALYQKRRIELLKALMAIKSSFNELEDVLLQKGANIGVEEKVVSIGFALMVTLSISALLGLFGVEGFIVSLVLFAIGFVISRIFATKVYGKPREESQLNNFERGLLNQVSQTTQEINTLQEQIKNQAELIVFADYQRKMLPMMQLKGQVLRHDMSNLSWRYQKHFARLQEQYQLTLAQLINCYAPKKRK